MDDLEVKARRRIKRFIKTGERQARVHPLGDGVFEYRSGHYGPKLTFKEDKMHRLRKRSSQNG